MFKKKMLHGALASFLVLALSACGGSNEASQNPKPSTPAETKGETQTAAVPEINIGAVYGLTGPVAIYSTSVVNAIELAKEEINKEGKIKLNVTLEDDRSDKNEAINLYQKFVERDKVDVIIGPLLGKQVFAAAPLAQDSKVPVMLTTVATPGVTGIGDYIFRTSGESTQFIPKAVEAAVQKFGVKKIAIIHAKDDEFTIGEYKAFKSAFEKHGVEIVADETYITGDLDFRAQLTNIKSKSPDMIAIAAQAEEVVAITTQARQLGVPENIHFIGGNAFNAANTLKEAGKAMEGALSATPWFIEMDSPENLEFVKKYKEKFKADPDWLSSQTYDALNILAQAYLSAGITSDDSLEAKRTKLKDAIASIKSYKGTLGEFGFNEVGDPTVQGTVITVKDGKHVLFK